MKRSIGRLCGKWQGWVALTLLASPVAIGQEPVIKANSPAERSLMALLGPIDQRHVVRNDAGHYDIWLISSLSLDAAADQVRKAIGSRRDLGDGARLQPWTWLEGDRSYLLELAGPRRIKLRLTRHLKQSLIELEDLGTLAQAPPWAPAYMPPPLPLAHGSVR